MKKLRVGVIGVGYLGQFHAEKYARMNDVELVGVVDIEKKRAEIVAEKVNAKPYTDYKSLFGNVDAVSIAAPTSVHFVIARDFLKKNIDIMIEKPITETTEESDELIHLAETRDLIIQVGHLERFNPAIVALKDIVKKPMFIGTLNASLIHPREIFKCALEKNAAFLILVHNHPSGTADPSESDIQITKQINEAGKLMGIEVLYHVIITKKQIFSFKNNNLIF